MKIEFRQRPDVNAGGETTWSLVELVLDFLGDCLPVSVFVPIVVIYALIAWGIKVFAQN